MSNKVATTQQGNVPAALSAEEEQFLVETQGLGLENVRLADQVLPRLKLIQKMSPEWENNNPEYIEGAKIGQFFNTATRKLYDQLILVPASYQIQFVEWKPNRGGLVKNWMQDSRMYDRCSFVEEGEKKFFKTPGGNIMQATGTFFCLEASGEWPEFCVISLASTQYKHSQEWVTKITGQKVRLNSGQLITPAPFFRSYKAEPQPETSGKNTWLGWKVTPGEPTLSLKDGAALRMMARDLAEAVKAGTVKAEIEEEGGGASDEKAPF